MCGLYIYPPRLPDLTPLDYFVWGFVKEKCFRDPIPTTIPELKENVEVIASISDESLVGMVDNIRNRMELCLARGGQHMERIIN